MSRSVRRPICNSQFAIRNLQSSSPSTVYRLPSTRRSRAAFTLIELLMVIVIIGMLVALASTAAVRAIATGLNAQITTEIGLPDSAMQTYKNEIAGGAPPDCTLMTAALGTPASSPTANQAPVQQDTVNRQNRILAHFRKAYPRLNFAYGYGPGTQQGTLQNAMQQAFKNYDASTPPVKYGGYALTAGAVWGDMDNLDPAEALVFWLGGPPAPPYLDPSGKWLFSLRGFSANKLNPLDLIATSRGSIPFDFQQSRLGDADGDGWPEYYPPVGTLAQPPGNTAAVSSPVPPYVYFDAVSYTSLATMSPSVLDFPLSAAYPSPLSSGTTAATGKPGIQPSGQGQWGVVIPYTQAVSTAANNVQVSWINPQKFQIISSGLDQMYYFDPSGLLTRNALRITTLPSGYSQGDLDNLTNFNTGVLQP
ncbi:MAG: hypothetical protein B7Z73_13595 [Planctomycetia bacterium 21-64-5]|nr:MAG: hypothetical protein B7Z73_13595 [Planctomycetia bacterium 21-64-5]